jgi:hypothetical protein
MFIENYMFMFIENFKLVIDMYMHCECYIKKCIQNREFTE